ncbi:hypothetical protein MXD81_04810 [Microbacteriaceae bacterium K1510]|nr:hypothetical protein [Microbacteriaceae bacterium K1510]
MWPVWSLVGILVALVPAHAAPSGEKAALSTADIVCTARKTDRRFGYRYRYDVTLSVRAGQVRRFNLSQRATSKDGDDQGCAIGLDDFKQEAGAGVIVLRDANAKGEAKPRCTIRITTEGQQIRIRIGDAAEEGNDCRGGDNVMYCSPRSFWADVIIDRKTSACRPVE